MRAVIRFGFLAAIVATSAAHAQSSRVQVGVLECRGGASVGFIVGSVTNLGCVLRSDGGRREEPYVATIRKVGLDIGITQETALAWAVFAPVEQMGPGALSGNYGGAQGSASIGVGLGANVLVGGSANSIALQPLSLQGSTGINVAAGLESLELRPADNPFMSFGPRIVIVGASGSGKTTMARALSKNLTLDLLELDPVHWTGKVGTQRDEDEAKALVSDFAARPKWIIEGVYGWLAAPAIQRASTLIWLDLP